jgi:hypothetical protein
MEGSLSSSTGRVRSSQQLGSKNPTRQRQIGSKKPSADADKIGDKWTDDWMYVYTPDQVFLDQHLTPSEREFKGKNEDMKNFMRQVFFGDNKKYVMEEKPPDSMGDYEKWYVPRGKMTIQETGKPTITKTSPSFELTQSQNPDEEPPKSFFSGWFGL